MGTMCTMSCQHLPATIRRSDLTLTCSPVEEALLKTVYQIPPHKLCPAPFFASQPDSKPQSFSQRSHFMTIGNWRHPPNRDGVQWLCQHIWPSIRTQLPDAELHIYGAYMSKGAQQFHKPVSHCLICGTTVYSSDAQLASTMRSILYHILCLILHSQVVQDKSVPTETQLLTLTSIYACVPPLQTPILSLFYAHPCAQQPGCYDIWDALCSLVTVLPTLVMSLSTLNSLPWLTGSWCLHQGLRTITGHHAAVHGVLSTSPLWRGAEGQNRGQLAAWLASVHHPSGCRGHVRSLNWS